MKILLQTIILCILATLIFCSAVAQQSAVARQTDSILSVLPSLPDAEKLETIGKLIVLNNREPSVKIYINMLINEAQRQKNIEMEGRALANLAFYYTMQFDTDSIFTESEDIIQFLRTHNLYDLLSTVHNNVIMRHSVAGRTLTALRKAEEAYEYSKEIQDELFTAQMLTLMANLYSSMNFFEEALRLYTESIKMGRKASSEKYFVNTYNLIIVSAIELKRYEEAMQYTDSMQLEIDRLQRNKPELNLKWNRFRINTHKVRIYAEMKQYDDALEALKLTEALFDPQWKGTIDEATFNETIFRYHYATGNFQKALEHLNSAIQFVETGTENIELLLGYNMLNARLHFDMGDYRHAAQTAFNVIESRDSLNTQRFSAQLNELRTIFELDKLELEAVRKQAHIRQQRIIILASLGGCFLLAVIVACVAWNRKKLAQKNIVLYRQIKQQDKVAEERDAIEKENKILKARYQIDNANQENDENDEKTEYQTIFDRVHEYLLTDRNFAKEETNINKLIKSLNVSRTYLYEAVKAVTKKPLQVYINNLRLEEAKKLLDTTNEKIEIISELCGYNVKSTFNRQFKEVFGFTPSEYRNVGKKNITAG